MPNDTNDSRRNLVVIGASAGGVEALRFLIADLPKSFRASLFVVQHMSREGPGMLPDILSRAGNLRVVVPRARQAIERETLYLPLPDHHLVIEGTEVLINRGPMQNRNRPSVDVLFRSAALAYGPRVVGVVLTGMLDDGTAGLLTIKRRGGIAIVQDPSDAMYPGMPASALNSMKVDHCVPLSEVPKLLRSLAGQHADSKLLPSEGALERELRADEGVPLQIDDSRSKPSPYSCPECHGVLWLVEDPDLPRFRCRVGHGYSLESLISDQDDAVEDALWAGVRSLEERASLSRRMAEQWPAMESFVREQQDKAARCIRHAEKIREFIIQVNDRH